MVALAVLICSAAMSVLALEIIWMRLFSIESFSSFGGMILSIGLLGFGIGGGILTVFSEALQRRRNRALYIASLAFPAAVALSVLVTRRIPFIPQTILQDSAQWGHLALFYVVLSLPFIAGALIIGLILTSAGERVGKLYLADLVGSGLGGLLVLASFYLVHPDYLPLVVVALFVPGLVAAAWLDRGAVRIAAALAVGLGAAGALAAFGGIEFSEYKGISYSLASKEVSGAEVVEEAWGPLGYLQVVSSTSERTAFGLSSQAPMEALPPVQKGLYADGAKVASIARRLAPEESEYMDWLLTSLPFSLIPEAHVLLAGLGGGEGVAQALRHGARRVEVAEPNSVLIDLVAGRFAEENDGLLARPEVAVAVAEARDLAARSPGRYDLVLLSLADASGLSQSGSKAVSESYQSTVEAMEAYLGSLSEGGVLAVFARLDEPPRGALRVVPGALTAAAGLFGRETLGRSVAYVRTEFAGLLMIKRGGFSQEDVDRLLEEGWNRGFQSSYYPGMSREVLEQKAEAEDAFWADLKTAEGVDLGEFDSSTAPQDPFFDCIASLVEGEETAATYMAAYPFDITPTWDDRPYPSAMLKEGSFEHIRKSAYNPAEWEREIPHDLWGEPLLWATLLQALLFAAAILAAPLAAGWRRLPKRGKGRTLVYFACLGAGYMFVEMVLIQKLTLYVSAPAYAAAVVLGGMLVFSGLGAGLSSKLPPTSRKGIGLVVAAIVALVGLYGAGLTPLMLATLSLPESARLLLSLAAIAPLGLVLGFPFPLGMSALARAESGGLAAWGWGVNGAFSVVGVLLAQALAVRMGFAPVLWSVAALYLLALIAFPIAR
jgi:hypothetical protein